MTNFPPHRWVVGVIVPHEYHTLAGFELNSGECGALLGGDAFGLCYVIAVSELPPFAFVFVDQGIGRCSNVQISCLDEKL